MADIKYLDKTGLIKVKSILDGLYSPKSHNHNNLYYTETEVNNLLAGKSDTSHTHNYLPSSGGDLKGTTNYNSLPDSNNLFGTTKGLIHIRNANSSNYYGNAITWAQSDNTSAQAGIYVTTGGSYGSEMWFGTTHSFANGVYAALKIDNVGKVHAVRNNFVGNLTGNASTATSATSATTATTATKLSSNAGSAVNPIYFSGGKPVACSYSLNTTVPSNALFTDTALGKTFKTLSSASHTGWTNNTTDDKIIPTMSFMAYWNGAYNSSGSSNLQYCDRGRFGTASTYSVTTSITSGSGSLITSGAVYTGLASKASSNHTHDGVYLPITPSNLNLHGDWTNDFGIHFKEGGSNNYGFSLCYGSNDKFRLYTRTETENNVEVFNVGRGETTVVFASTPKVGSTLVSLADHTHDNRYYTETEVNNLLAGKSNTSHTHNYVDAINANTDDYTSCIYKPRIKTSYVSNQGDFGAITVPTYCSNSSDYFFQTELRFPINSALQYRVINHNKTGDFITLLDSSNYNSYSPTLTGTGASGTWPINITGSSSSCTGNASSATKLTTNAGSATNPIYFSGGKPVVCSYSLNKTVPANAVFTDTASGKTFKTGITNATHSEWDNTSNQDKIIPTMNFIAYWNGSYNSGGSSNLQYCDRGRFGIASTYSVTTSITDGSSSLITSGAVYTGLAGKANSSHGHSNYVTTDTNQTITGLKTFRSDSKTTGVSLILKNNSWYTGMSTAIDFYNGSSKSKPSVRIDDYMDGDGSAGGTMRFFTQGKSSENPNPNDLTERMRINKDGEVLINTTTGGYKLNVNGSANATTLYENGARVSVNGHTHDGRYYTETEVNNLLAGKSNTGHTHSYLPLSGGTMDSGAGINWPNSTSSTWDTFGLDTHQGIKILNTIGTESTNAPNKYAVGLSVSGYYGFCLAYYGGGDIYWLKGNSDSTWKTIIHSGNIGSQSVNYANSAGAVVWDNVTGKPNTFTPSSHSHDGIYARANYASQSELSDCNSVNSTGFWTHSDFANRPDSVYDWGSLMNIRLYNSNNKYHRQLFFDCYGSDKIWTRSDSGGTWTSWKRLALESDIPTSLPANGGSSTYAARLGDANGYYTKSSLDTALSGKSNNGHTHESLIQGDIHNIKSAKYNWTLTAGTWYRVMISDSNTVADSAGEITVYMHNPGSPLIFKLDFGLCYHSSPFIHCKYYTAWSGSQITKARIVYKTSYGNQKAYLELYANSSTTHDTTFSFVGTGWSFMTPTATAEDYVENLNSNLTITIGNDNENKTVFSNNIKAPTFIGSLSGNASSATKLTTDAGSATKPIYFSGGKPVACSYSLNKTVPANAVFTDTNTWRDITDSYSGTSTSVSLSQKGGNDLYNALVNGYASSADYISNSTYYYNGNVIKNTTSADDLFGLTATDNRMFPAFMESHPLWNGYADVAHFTGYCKWGATQLATEYNAISPRIAIRKYNQTRSDWGNWTELLTPKYLENTIKIGKKLDARKAVWLKLTTPGHTGADAWYVGVDDTSDNSYLTFGYGSYGIDNAHLYADHTGKMYASGYFKKDGTSVSYVGHNHNDKYYTESEIDTKLASKANSSHGHSNYVTTDTNQTITGLKTFRSDSKTTGVSLILKNNSWYGGMSTAIDFYNGSSKSKPSVRIDDYMDGDGSAGGTLRFFTQGKSSENPNPNELTERMRINKDGEVLINTTTGGYNLNINGSANATTLYENGTRVSVNGHTHDGRYYTETEVNNLLASKASSDHGHDGIYARANYASQSELSDCNSVNSTGFWTHGGFAHRPDSVANWGSLMNIRLYNSNNDYHRQLFFDCYSSDKIWTRSADGGTWTSWKRLVFESDIPTSLPASDVYAWAKKSSLALADVPDLSSKYLSLSGGIITGALDLSNSPNASDSYKMGLNTAGHVSGGIHFKKDGNNDYGQAITWSYGDNKSHAGIYVKSSGAYGTKMYLCTTNLFADGSKAALEIDQSGNITALRNKFIGDLTGNASTATNVAWSGITGKPSTFTPSTHTHTSFVNDITVEGSVTAAAGFFDTSDERLKDFYDDIDVDFDKLRAIPKKYFSWKDDKNKEIHLGTSAQELQKIYPEIVKESETGELSVDYAKLSVISLAAIDKLYDKINKIEQALIDKGIL